MLPLILKWMERYNVIPDQMILQLRKLQLFPFILHWVKRDNVIPDQLLLQLKKYTNCILFHVIDKIVSSGSQLNWKGNIMKDQLLLQLIHSPSTASHSMWLVSCHSRSNGPPIKEVYQLHPISCNLYYCYLLFSIELKEIMPSQISCSSN